MSGRLHRALGDTLIWLAVMLGVLWLLILVEVAPGASGADVRIPDRLKVISAGCAAILLVPAVPTLVAWSSGRPWARGGTVLTGVALIATSTGWGRVDDVTYLYWVSMVAGIVLIGYSLRRLWPELAVRGDTSPLIARIGMGLLLLVVFAGAVTAVVVGWDLGLVNRHPEDEHGLHFMVPGMAVATACLGFARHFFPAPPRPTPPDLTDQDHE